MPDDSNTANRQKTFKTNKGKITTQIRKSEKIEQEVRKEEESEVPHKKS